MRARLPNELLLINALTLVLVVILVFTPPNVVRTVLGLLLVLLFPGYTFLAALFPGKDALGGMERLALSLGLSIITVPFIVLILNYTPWGIRLLPVVVSVTIFVWATSAVAWYRRRGRGTQTSFNVTLNLDFAFWKKQNPVDRALTIALIVVVLGAAGAVIYAVTTPRQGERSTEFYITGLKGKIADYPTDLKVGEEGKVIVRVTNYEKAAANYRLEVRIDGTKTNETGPIALADGQKWEGTVGFSPSKAGDNQKVEFLLFKDRETVPHLNPLYLWVNVKK